MVLIECVGGIVVYPSIQKTIREQNPRESLTLCCGRAQSVDSQYPTA